TLALGVVLHLVLLSTKSLLGPIVLHTHYNAMGLSRAKLAVDDSLILTGPSDELVLPPLLVATSVVAVIALCWILCRTRVSWMLASGREWSPGYITAEMPPFEPAVLRRRALRSWSAVPAAGAYLAFGVCLAQAATGWLGQSAVMAQVRRAE